MQVAMTHAAKTAANVAAGSLGGSSHAGAHPNAGSQSLRQVHRQQQSNHKQAVDELDVQVRPQQKNQRQPVEKLHAAGAMRFQHQRQGHAEQHHGEEDRPRHQVKEKRRAGNDRQHARQPESAGKTARHPVDEVGDAESQQRSVQPNADQPEPGVGARHQNFVAPTVSHPGTVGCRPREKAGVGNGPVLDDPVASLEMPPDVEVEHRELQIEGDHSHRDQQAGQREQLQPAQTEERAQFVDKTHFRFSPFALRFSPDMARFVGNNTHVCLKCRWPSKSEPE